MAARRAAVAYIGGAGNAPGSAGLEAVAAVFRGDRNAGVRRTAGDALRRGQQQQQLPARGTDDSTHCMQFTSFVGRRDDAVGVGRFLVSGFL